MGHRATQRSPTGTAGPMSLLATALLLLSLPLVGCGSEPPDRDALEGSVTRQLNTKGVRDYAFDIVEDTPPYEATCPTIEAERAVCKFGMAYDRLTGQDVPDAQWVPITLVLDGEGGWRITHIVGEPTEEFLEENNGDVDYIKYLQGEIKEQDG